LRDSAGRLSAACVALAALSLLLPWALAFDPWSWVVWGREVTRLELDTAGGPSWKPLPVVATTPLALAGGAAPALWLVLARAGGLLAVAGAAVLAHRLTGAASRDEVSARGAAAAAAALTVALSSWWLFNTALGNSEGLLAAAVLWAVVAHLAGRTRAALVLALAAALLRPEAWPFLGLYALWLWRTRRESLGVLALALLPVPLLWFGPDAIGVGGALGASDAARGTASPQSAVNADFPALEVLLDFGELLTPPVLLLAIAGAALGGRTARLLAAGAAAWVLLVALMTEAGYAGNPRYNVAPAAVACVLAGVGVAAVARRIGAAIAPAHAWGSRRQTAGPADAQIEPPRGAAPADAQVGPPRGAAPADAQVGPPRGAVPAAALAAVLAAATLAFTAGDLGDQLDELGARADRREQLDALVDRAGEPCEPAYTNQPMKAMLAWRLDAPMEHLADRPRRPGVVFRAPPGYDGGPALPDARGFAEVARDGEWTLAAAC
jgi:hypothetical protein